MRFAKFAAVVAGLAAALTGATGSVPAGAEEYFYVVNTNTRLMAEVFAHRTNNGAPVGLWPHYGGTSQQFNVWRLPGSGPTPKPAAELWFLLKARHSGKCLRTNGYQSGAAIVQANCGGESGQLWRVRTIVKKPEDCPNPSQCFGGQRLVLENYYDRGKRCLDAANGKFPAPPLQGAPLQAWDCISKFSAANAVNQDWELINIKDWNAPGPRVH